MFSAEQIQQMVTEIVESWNPTGSPVGPTTNLKFDLHLDELDTAELGLRLNDEILPYYEMTEEDYVDLGNITVAADLIAWMQGLQDLHWDR